MKNIFIISGTMGVGKTTVCQKLKNVLDNSVFLDGDRCWDMHPFQVNNETKEMVTENICFILNNFIRCSVFENIIFCWVMDRQEIIDSIVSKLDLSDCITRSISLVCSPEALKKRLNGDIERQLRTPDIIERSLERLPHYGQLDTVKIDVSDKSVEHIVNEIVMKTGRTI
ncbi:MAG: AAA family ATPase [Ruminococcus sp.]|nr:AAA family ATPase [Ruminococcus sp.]